MTNWQGEPLAPIQGIFYKTLRLMEEGIRPLYVFDGLPPSEKKQNSSRLRMHLNRLWKSYEEAKERQDDALIRNLFQSQALVYRKANLDAIELLKAMGVPAILAPSEAEAQGSSLVQQHHADCLYTPDYDALLFGCPYIIRRIDFAQRQVEAVELNCVLSDLGITLHQLIDIAILIGTDFNKGSRHIGQKRGFTLIKRHGCIEAIPNISPPLDLDRLRSIFISPVVTPYEPQFRPPNVEMVHALLLQSGFRKQRADRGCTRLLTAFRTHRTYQDSLG